MSSAETRATSTTEDQLKPSRTGAPKAEGARLLRSVSDGAGDDEEWMRFYSYSCHEVVTTNPKR